MKKNKGFTLIELLAVIVILGVIMMIAIPSVTGYITSSRKSSFASTGGHIVTAVRDYAIMHNGLPTYVGQAIAYSVVDSNGNMQVTLESGGKESAFGKKWKAGYNYVVIIAAENNNYDYYYTGMDTAGNYIPLTLENDLDGNKVIKTATMPATGEPTFPSGNTVTKFQTTESSATKPALLPTQIDNGGVKVPVTTTWSQTVPVA